MFRISFILALTVAALCKVHAQDRKVLSQQDFISTVLRYHPVASQADLVTDYARENLLSAKGQFDPVLQTGHEEKTFDGTNYYRYQNSQLKIPIPIGVELKTGIENIGGQYKNPEFTSGKTTYLGIEMNVLNGLIFDSRRAAINKASIYKQQSEQERLVMLNDLVFESYQAYYEWAAAWQILGVYTNYVDVASDRMRLMRIYLTQGERAVSDTIEAFVQLQNYRLLQQQASLELANCSVRLSGFLWSEQKTPYLLPEEFIPDTSGFEQMIFLAGIEDLEKQIVGTNPQTKIYEYKLKTLEIQRRLNLQSFLPTATVSANILNRGYFQETKLSNNFIEDNYKFGVQVKLPLFMRTARGEYRKTLIEISKTDLERREKIWSLQNKLRQYYNQTKYLHEQVILAKAMLANYIFLLNIEKLKFEQGETSLFIINARESKVIELSEKLIDLRLKYLKSVNSVQWLTNNLISPSR